MVALYEPDATDAIFDDHFASAIRQELPLRRAKTDDRVRPYNPKNGLSVRALVVAVLGRARLHFGMKGTDLDGRENRRSRLISAELASQRLVWYKGVKGVPND
jgi:hypothetical protein